MTMPPKKPTNQQRFEILLENVEGKLQVVAEGHGMLAENMVRLEAGIGKLGEGHEMLAGNMVRLEGKVDGLDRKIAEVDHRLSTKIDTLAEEVHELRSDIQEKVLPRLDGHESRLTALEGKPAA